MGLVSMEDNFDLQGIDATTVRWIQNLALRKSLLKLFIQRGAKPKKPLAFYGSSSSNQPKISRTANAVRLILCCVSDLDAHGFCRG